MKTLADLDWNSPTFYMDRYEVADWFAKELDHLYRHDLLLCAIEHLADKPTSR
jgi:hypothetical protein